MARRHRQHARRARYPEPPLIASRPKFVSQSNAVALALPEPGNLTKHFPKSIVCA